MGRSAVATFLRSSWETYRIEERMRWMTQVCTIALGQAASIASGSRPSPSQHTNRTSLMPRLRSSVSTPIQKRARRIAQEADDRQERRLDRTYVILTAGRVAWPGVMALVWAGPGVWF